MLSREELNSISAAYLEVVAEKNTMVCKDCGDECGKPTNEECPHDCMDKNGTNWVAKSTNEAMKADDYTVRMIKDNPKMKNTILKKLDPKARKAVMKALKADDEDPSDDDSMDEAAKKEDASNDQSDDGEGMDKVDPKAAKKKFKDRKDKDIDNDGDTDSTDKYLHKRRKAISKSMDKEDDMEEGKRGFIAAAKAAKDAGEKHFMFAGKRYACKEYTDTEIDEIVGAVAGVARVAKSAASAAGKGAKRVGKAAADIVTPDDKKESYTFDELVDMDDEVLDEIMEKMDRKEVDEIVGTVARGIGRIAKKTVNRFSTSGRADAAQAKLAKMKKKAADKDRLAKAKAGIAQMKAKQRAKNEAATAAPKKESTMKTFKQVREDAAHTKGATKPEGMHDKEGKKSKEFRDKHSVETNDSEEKGHKDAADAGRKGPNGKKRAGDNPKGDKNIINKPTETK